MIHNSLLSPKSIVVVGGSENTEKPGGKIVKNLLDGNFQGQLLVLNPGRNEVQGLPSYAKVSDIPGTVDLAILAIAAPMCPTVVKELGQTKGTTAFIVISAGFSEEGEAGALLEKQLVEAVEAVNGVLIGPNCIGMITPAYNGVFTAPVPKLNPSGCDFVSGSGATAVFILESALPKGLSFSSLITVGNSAQVGIEEVLAHWDATFDETSSRIKLIYVENIKDPDKLLKHASSLIRKGCKIAAIKSGVTEAGKRATSSHTGAMASADSAVEALFRKAGIVRCFGREELITVASVFMYKALTGKNLAIITQAGGPGVMLTDALSDGGLNIPAIEGEAHDAILSMLNPGASASNPIDILATGTAEQLQAVMEYCDQKMDDIDGMIVIFGSTGLTKVYDAFEVIHKQMQQCRKPVFPILPSTSSAHHEVAFFLSKGHINFPDEVVLGKALTKVNITPPPEEDTIFLHGVDIERVRQIIDGCSSGFQEPEVVNELLLAAGIPTVEEGVASNRKALLRLARSLGYPVAMKVIGPVHKSDVGGVTLNIKSDAHLVAEYRRMRKIKGVKALLLQKMEKGTELFIGAKYESRFGHVILCGLGGIFVESLGDHAHGLAPLTFNEAHSMIRSLRSYPVVQGTRGQEGVDEDLFAEIIVRLSSLLRYATEIKELDLNPLIGNKKGICVVDARVLIEK